MTAYEDRVKAQIDQYANPKLQLFPPKAHHFWMQNYVYKKVRSVFDIHTHIDFYIQPLLHFDGRLTILSVGSGDGNLEAQIAEALIKNNQSQFLIVMTEISPIRQDRAKALIAQKGLDAYFAWQVIDLNSDFPAGSYDLIFAHHVLHHIVELERLFANIEYALKPDGTFSTIDMIGRNGHMRWDETKAYLDLVWDFMPNQWKYNFQHQAHHEDFLNFDCSNSGFEGIRAQDILPLLVDKFHFNGFVGEGGFLDILLERGYGQSIDMDNRRDASLVKFLCETNELLVESLRTKPTMMFAQMCRKDAATQSTRIWKNMTPEACIRPVQSSSNSVS